MPWDSFTLRAPEAAVRGLILGRRRSRDPAETAAGDRFNLTAMLLGVVADPPRLLALQRAMFAHAPDVLYEAPATSPDPNPNSTPNPNQVGSLLLLTKLDLGKNKIARIEGLETLVQLAQLSLEDNEIASLAGLGKLASLMEVYIGNNRLSSLKEVQQLKGRTLTPYPNTQP